MKWFEVFITGPYYKKIRFVTFITGCTLDLSYVLLVCIKITSCNLLVFKFVENCQNKTTHNGELKAKSYCGEQTIIIFR